MLISIITPSFNSFQHIKDTYKSILNQSYNSWEWIVTDDCSTDLTYDLLLSMASKDQRIKIFKNIKNSGAAISRNNSISKAKGEFISFIDSDDVWFEDKLINQLEFMSSNSIDFSFTAYELIDENSVGLGVCVDTHNVEFVIYEDMLRKKATIGCSTVMLRRSAFEDISMPLIRTGQDYGLWLKLLKTGAKAYKLNEILTQYRISPNSISRNKIKKAKRQWQIYRKIEMISFFKSIEYFCFYAWRAVFRK